MMATADPTLVILLDVAGTPAPQGSKRHVGRGIMVESSKAVKPWREAVKAAALDRYARGKRRITATGPVAADIVFRLTRPRSHYRTGANSHLLRDSAPRFPATRPDVDKLVRSTLDALKDCGAYGDDGQVARLDVLKRYVHPGEVPGARITVREMTP